MAERERVYLDVCALCRPFDDQSALRIRLETDAYYLIVQAIEAGAFQLIVSRVHHKEVNAIRDLQERYEILSLFETLGNKADCDPSRARSRAEELHSKGFGVADAAHAAYAEFCADYLITYDNKFLMKCKREIAHLRAMNPVEFCIEKELQ